MADFDIWPKFFRKCHELKSVVLLEWATKHRNPLVLVMCMLTIQATKTHIINTFTASTTGNQNHLEYYNVSESKAIGMCVKEVLYILNFDI